jgi:hypothetical protein
MRNTKAAINSFDCSLQQGMPVACVHPFDLFGIPGLGVFGDDFLTICVGLVSCCPFVNTGHDD